MLYATSLLVQLVESESLQRSLRRCEQQLRREVTLRPVQAREFEQVHLDRLTAHYGDVLRLAELVVRSTFVDNFRTSSRGTYGVLVNMNRVFEASVERAARQAVEDTAWSVEGQAQLRRLVTGGSPTINMYSDFLLRGPNDEVRLVGDAKWKTGRVSQSDVYQMTSYQLADDVPGTLVYPSQMPSIETDYVIDDRLSLSLRELPTGASVPNFDRFTEQLEQALRAEFESLINLDE